MLKLRRAKKAKAKGKTGLGFNVQRSGFSEKTGNEKIGSQEINETSWQSAVCR